MQLWLRKPISKPELVNISLCERFALTDLSKGTDELEPWRILRDAAAVTLTMAAGGVGPEALEPAQAALDLLHQLYSRDEPLTPQEVTTISEMLLWHDAQRTKIARSTVLHWLEETSKSYNKQ